MTYKEIFKVYKNVFDEKTISSIWKLITERRFEGLESPIKIGKESNVFSAITKSKERVAVKVFRITSSNFFTMSRYLSMDPRFRKFKSRRGTVLTWAKREFVNLKKAYEAGVNVPKPIAVEDNVIVMGFIGNQPPEPPLADPLLKESCDNPKKMFELLFEDIKKLYRANLVHGDLNEFNIMNNKEKPVIIDLSHGTPVSAPAAIEMLERDLKNVCRFFNKKGLNLDIQKLLKEIRSVSK